MWVSFILSQQIKRTVGMEFAIASKFSFFSPSNSSPKLEKEIWVEKRERNEIPIEQQ